LRRAERETVEIEVQLSGDTLRRRLREPTTPSILSRVRRIVGGHWDNRGGPTATHRRELEVASEAYEEISPRLRQLIADELPAIEVALAEAGAPWTPGRRPLP
jgi:hypothetical protein